MPLDRCRTCLGVNSLSSIFQTHDSISISSKVMSISNIKIAPNDGLSDKICYMCVHKLNDCLNFVRLCENSDRKQRESIEKWNKTEESSSELDSDLSQDKFPEYKVLTESEPSDLLMVINATITKEIKKDDDGLNTSKKQIKQQCPTCGKVMSSRFRLTTHLRTHTGERPYTCPHCSKNFALSQNLKVHLRTHTGEKPLQCSVCGESFAHTAGLATHRRKHTGQTPYHCRLCPRSFRTIGHLQYHVRRHTGEKNFECDTCGKAFITRSDLKQHILTHTGERPHVCPVCGIRLTRSSHLKRHIQHSHGSQFSCSSCSMNFKQQTDYEEHKKDHENEKK